jgi:Rps23 Pro-64 3,4-dihydroxylase Tpa1-like proline 4-hydroxylase
MSSFLSQAQHAHVLALAAAQQDKLQRAEVQKQGNVNPLVRSAWVLLEKEIQSVLAWFLSRVRANVPTIFPRLQMKPFDIGEVELQMTIHRAGDFYTVHEHSALRADLSIPGPLSRASWLCG